MKFDLSLQQYVEWEMKKVMPLKGKFGYRVILKYMDGSERPQQKAGFETEKAANSGKGENNRRTVCRNLCGVCQRLGKGFHGVLGGGRYPEPRGEQ